MFEYVQAYAPASVSNASNPRALRREIMPLILTWGREHVYIMGCWKSMSDVRTTCMCSTGETMHVLNIEQLGMCMYAL